MSPQNLTKMFVFCAVLGGLGKSAEAEPPQGETALAVFEQRIMPIFRSPEPSSCIQCHLAAVDLKDYIRPSHEETFASLRDQGLIDVASPEKSKILTLIQMGEEDLDEGARLIHAKTRRAEYDAFAAWIKACCSDSRLRNLPEASDSAPAAGPQAPLEVVRHARKSRVTDSFVRNVWSQRMRCYPCHSPHEIDRTDPAHEKAIARAETLLEQYGERMHLFRETPEATLEHLIAKSRETADDSLPLINLQQPAKSLLVLKPTSKLPKQIEKGVFEEPSYFEPVSHMGGLKMHPDDHSYKAFLAWIRDYAAIAGGEYTSVDDLPPDNWYPTEHAVLLQNAPDDWPPLTTVQLFVHSKQRDGSWSDEPVAFTQGKVSPRRILFGVLFILASPDSQVARRWNGESVRLEPGPYLLKAYLDTHGRLANDPAILLDSADYRGQVEIEARWGVGFAQREQVAGDEFRQ